VRHPEPYCKRLQSLARHDRLTTVPQSVRRDRIVSTERGTPMKVNKKSAVAFGAIALASTLVLAGCGGSSSDEGTAEAAGEITVWVDADRAGVLEDAAKAFTADTGVKVKLVQKEFGEIRDQFVQQVPTGKGPDIAVGAHDWLG